mmetsp:Transcript_8071/g.16252  ORF Transcript_8071/g.16252 Transcript_8071/m.16252 type:complete len:122 (+) Transcript_8071:2219-2584(+)
MLIFAPLHSGTEPFHFRFAALGCPAKINAGSIISNVTIIRKDDAIVANVRLVDRNCSPLMVYCTGRCMIDRAMSEDAHLQITRTQDSDLYAVLLPGSTCPSETCVAIYLVSKDTLMADMAN